MGKTRFIDKIMADGGYVSAAVAAEALGFEHVSSVHRLVRQGKLRSARHGMFWFISVASMLRAYADNHIIVERIRALGVTPRPELSPSQQNKADLRSGHYEPPKKRRAKASDKKEARHTRQQFVKNMKAENKKRAARGSGR